MQWTDVFRIFELDTVTVDNERAVFGAMQHLVGLGHRRIAMVGGPIRVSTASERQAGYVRGLESAGLPFDPELIVTADFRAPLARELVRELMSRDVRPSAIFTVNNLATLGTLQALRELALRVPDDVSVCGFDDLLAGELLDPPLTAIDQPTYDLGQRAIDLLVRRITTPDASVESVVLDTTLLIRASTGPAPGSEGRARRTDQAARRVPAQTAIGGVPFETTPEPSPNPTVVDPIGGKH